jgi:hypothetical protein
MVSPLDPCYHSTQYHDHGTNGPHYMTSIHGPQPLDTDHGVSHDPTPLLTTPLQGPLWGKPIRQTYGHPR